MTTRDKPDPDLYEDIPLDIQQRFVMLATAFHLATGAPVEEIQKFMRETIKIYNDYMEKT